MALGALSLPAIEPAFGADNTAMVPVTAGNTNQKLGTIEIRSPMDDVMDFFAGIDKSLINLVQFAKKSFRLEEKDAQRESLARTNTDDDIPVEEGKSMFDTVKEAYDNVTFGEKMTAALLVGAIGLFSKFEPILVKVLTPIIKVLKKFVELVGVEGAFYTVLGSILAIKFLPLKKMAMLAGSNIVSATKAISSQVFRGGKGSIRNVFEGINKAGALALKGAKGALGIIEGGFKGLFNGVGKAFRGIRIGLVAMRTSLIPIVAGFIVPIAIAAAIGAVLFSLKSSIEVFKAAIDDGDSVMSALVKAGKDFFATLYTLPFTLIKNVVSYFAGMFGFDNFKEKLDSIDLKQGFIDIITSFVDKVKGFFAAIFDFDIKGIIDRIGNIGSQIANTLKGIAKGAVAMVAAAVPGGESPTEAFSRVYNEVLNTGEGVVKNEASEVANAPLVEDGAMAAAKAAMTTNESYITNNTVNNETNIMKEKIKELIKEGIERERIIRENKTSAPIMVNTNKGGDTNVNNNTTNVSGEPASDHSETTQKLLNSAMA